MVRQNPVILLEIESLTFTVTIPAGEDHNPIGVAKTALLAKQRGAAA
jgi:hypothetical protein